MDIDRAKEHDYYSTNEIKETFDVIVLSEVIEHLSFQDGIDLLKRLNGLLAAGGRLVVSVPNIHHPNAYLRDSDHKTPYSYEVLGAALINAGLKVKRLYRIYNDSMVRRFFRLYVMAWLHRYLDVDFAETRRGNSRKAANSDCGGGNMKGRMCKICGNTDGNKIHAAREMLFGYREEFKYIECSKCGVCK